MALRLERCACRQLHLTFARNGVDVAPGLQCLSSVLTWPLESLHGLRLHILGMREAVAGEGRPAPQCYEARCPLLLARPRVRPASPQTHDEVDEGQRANDEHAVAQEARPAASAAEAAQESEPAEASMADLRGSKRAGGLGKLSASCDRECD
jgi:hypothetical protein